MCLIFPVLPAPGECAVLLDPWAARGGMGGQAPEEPRPRPDPAAHPEELVRPEFRVELGKPAPLGRPAPKETLALRCLVLWPLFWPQLP